MPIYEYRCLCCGRISSHLVLTPSSFEPFCKYCKAKDVKKIISRVNIRLCEESRLERLMDPSLLGGLDENDPKSLKKVMDKMGSIVGDDLDGNINEIVDEVVEEASSDGNFYSENSSCANGSCDL